MNKLLGRSLKLMLGRNLLQVEYDGEADLPYIKF